MIERFAALAEAERAARFSPAERIAMMEAAERKAFLRKLPRPLREALVSWYGQARPGQQPPAGPWRTWMILGGRGFGKTRAGAQWVHRLAEEPDLIIALVGQNEDEVRGVMIEGPAGILACPGEIRPEWEPSLGRLTWPNGTRALVYSAANPDALRGPEHDHAWCDEIAKWGRGRATWDNLMLGLRRGPRPRVLATTTPRPTPLMRGLAGRDDVAVTRGRTRDAALLAPGVVGYLTELYGGTRLGRQELDGELIEDVEGSLWPRDLIERCRAPCLPMRFAHGEGDQALPGGGVEGSEADGSRESLEGRRQLPLHHAAHGPPPHLAMGRQEFRRVVVGVDPPASAEGTCGIVVCALGGDGIGNVLADASVSGRSPEGWARAVAAAAERWRADRVVAEGNQGGAMVGAVLRAADVRLPIRIVHAKDGKAVRAEPVAALFERGAARFAGAFPELEDELAGLIAGGGYEGPGRSPDRADAMVWALTELMLGRRRAGPRITFF